MCVSAFAHNNTPSIVISYTGEEFPVWVKSGSNTVLGSDLTQTAGEFIWVKVEAYSIKITVFGTFALQKRLFFVVGVSVFEPEASWTRNRPRSKIQFCTVHTELDCVHNSGFCKLSCPTCPYSSDVLWVTVWVSQSCHSAKVGVLGTF